MLNCDYAAVVNSIFLVISNDRLFETDICSGSCL